MERLIFGLVSLIGLVIMIVGAMTNITILSGLMFISGLLVMSAFGKAFFEYDEPGLINFQKFQK